MKILYLFFLLILIPVIQYADGGSIAIPCVLPFTCSGEGYRIFRGSDYQNIDFLNGTQEFKAGLPERFFDGVSWISDEVTQNSTHYIIKSQVSPTVISKDNCASMNVYEDSTLSNITSNQTAGVYHQKGTDDPLKGVWISDGLNDISCTNLSLIQNSTGSFISGTKLDITTGNTLLVSYDKKTDEELKKSWKFIEGAIHGKFDQKYGVIDIIKSNQADLLRIDDSEYEVVTAKIQEKENGSIKGTPEDEKSKETIVSNSIDFRKGKTNEYYGYADSKSLLQDVLVNTDGTNIIAHVRFLADYRELIAGEVIIIDPTSSVGADTNHYNIGDSDNNGACTVYTGGGRSANPSTVTIKVSETPSSNDCTIGTWEWDVSSIPDDIVSVDDADLSDIDINIGSSPYNCAIKEMVLQPSDLGNSDQDIFDDILDGTSYGNLDSYCTLSASNGVSDLGTSAEADIESAITGGNDWWAIGVHPSSFTQDATEHASIFGFTGTPTMILTITYTNPPYTFIIPKMLEYDETIGVSGNITITNSTGSFIETVNATNQAKFRITPSANQNFTMKESTDNFVVRKTINNSTASYDLWTDAESPTFIHDTISCPSNGVGTDITDLKVNDTDYSHITFFSPPHCNWSDIVKWNITATANGQSFRSPNATSIMKLEVINTGSFGVNPTSFTVNGTSIGATYSAPYITTSPFNMTDGKKTVYLEFELQLATPAVGGGGGGGGSGGGGSTTIPPDPTSANFINLNLIKRIHTAFLGQLIEDSIPFTWEAIDDLTINKILVAENPFTVAFQATPVTFAGDISGVSSGQLFYQIQVPDKECNDVVLVDCIDREVFQIPVTIEAESTGKTLIATAVIEVDLTTGSSIALIGVGVAVLLGIIGLAGGLARRKKGKSRKNGMTAKHLSR